MASAELEDLIARHFEGELDAADEARLEELLAEDPGSFDRFKGLVGIEGLLRARGVEPGARADLEGRVAESVRLEERRRRLTSRVMESLRGRRARRSAPARPVAAWVAAALAAAAFLGAVALVARPPEPLPEREAARREIPVPATADRPGEVAPVPEPQPPILKPADPPRPETPDAPQEVRPAPAPEAPRPAPPSDPPVLRPAVEPAVTVTAAAEISGLEGKVVLVLDAGRKEASAGPFPAGGGVETGSDGRAVLRWTDGTRVEFEAGTEARDVRDREPAGPGRKAGGRRFLLARGAVSVVATRQPADQPMVVATPLGEVRVLGTAFRLAVRPEGKAEARLEVTEGKVRFTRARDGKGVDVAAGQALAAGPESELAPKPIRPDEVVLFARHGRIAGPEWRLVADRRASGGVALEAQGTAAGAADHVSKRPSYVEFSFWAAAERDYRVWLRAASQPTGDPWTRDYLTLASADAEWDQKCRFFGTSGETAFLVSGVSKVSGYGWVGGFAEGAAEPPPLSIRFARPGPQTLRLYAVHPSIRVDAVWLSATQLSKPPVRQLPPPADR